MKNLLDKLFFRNNNLDDITRSLKELSLKTPTSKVFEAINLILPLVKLDMLADVVESINRKD